jgi:hypothetical protein
VSTAEHQDPSGLEVLPPDEALRRAKPLPPPECMVLEDVSDDDWTAFQEALAEQ